MWERSFVAMSMLLSIPLDEALAALPAGTEERLFDLTHKLRDQRRTVRAAAIAAVGQEIAIALTESTLL